MLTRTCDNPEPSCGGNDCSGLSVDQSECNNHCCPSKAIIWFACWVMKILSVCKTIHIAMCYIRRINGPSCMLLMATYSVYIVTNSCTNRFQ